MPTISIAFEHSIPLASAEEMAKRFHFVSNQIDDFRLLQRDGEAFAVEIDCGEISAPETDRLERNVSNFVTHEIAAMRPAPAKILWESAAQKPRMFATFADLMANGVAYETGEGQVAFSQPMISLVNYLDERVSAIVRSVPNAREFQYPTLLPTAALERFGYLKSFPQFVMFVTRLHNDIEVYEKFISEYAVDGALSARVFSQCESVEYCLPPTMCYHTYQQLRDSTVPSNLVVTAKGKSFRFESKYSNGMERLWDFTIREIVILGEQSFVLDKRSDFMNAVLDLVNELGLSGRCEVANDHFFVGPDAAAKIFSQRLMELKYELILDVAADRGIAAASFNFHGPFFGQCFGIRRAPDEPVVTGCIGVGLERLAYAFVSQHGLSPSGWPSAVRSVVQT